MPQDGGGVGRGCRDRRGEGWCPEMVEKGVLHELLHGFKVCSKKGGSPIKTCRGYYHVIIRSYSIVLIPIRNLFPNTPFMLHLLIISCNNLL